MVVFKIIALDLLVIRHCLVNCTNKMGFRLSVKLDPCFVRSNLVLLFSLVGTIFILITTPALISTYESFVLHSLENGTDKQK